MRITQRHAIEEHLRRRTAGAVLWLEDRGGGVARQLRALAEEYGIPVRHIKGRSEEKGYWLEIPDGSQPLLSWPALLAQLKEREEALLLFLDGITDPQNFGAILRSADQFGVDAVVSPTRRRSPLGPGALNASSGAAAWVTRCEVPNLVRSLEDLKERGFWIYGADLDGQPLPEVRFPPKVALVLGSEGSGLGRLVRQTCDHLVRIPTSGHLDSLNVSVAAGIFLYAIRNAG